jgi:MICOS complex subunit MIC12
VRWVQRTDWDDVREGMEERVAGLWAKAFGAAEEGSEISAKKSVPAVKSAPEMGKAVVQEKSGSFTTAAKAAWGKTKEQATQAASVSETKATQAKGIVAAAVEKGKDVVDKAKAVIGLAEEKVETAAKQAVAPKPLSDVEKALQQRYEKSAEMDKTVVQVLEERYTPAGQRDNSVLRGL